VHRRPLIAIDATSVPPRPAGAATYIINLVRALGRTDSDHDYAVYTRRHTLQYFQDLPASFEVTDVGDQSRWRRQVWEQTLLPLDLRKRHAALLHSPHHTTPLLYSPCPQILTVHDVTFFLLPQRYPWLRRYYFQAMTRLAAMKAAAVIVPSESVRVDASRLLGLGRKTMVATAEGVSESFRPSVPGECRAEVRERYGLPPQYVLSLGTREPGKNRVTIFAALRRLLDEGRDPHLVVVGQAAWGTAEEDASLESKGLRERVHFTGYVADADLPAIYAGADVFAFPSLYEGFGLPVLEAMASGVPVVTSNVSAMPEVAGDAALLVDPTDASALARAIASILDDQSLAARLRAAGLERARAFTWDACAVRTVAVYNKVLVEA